MNTETLKPIHPGEVLREEFLKPLGLSGTKLSEATAIPTTVIEDITSERQAVSADVALRLARFFGTSAQFWLGLQADYDLDIARERLGDRLEKEIVPLAA